MNIGAKENSNKELRLYVYFRPGFFDMKGEQFISMFEKSVFEN